MSTGSDKVGFSKEFEDLKLKQVALKEQLANLIEDMSYQKDTVGPQIKAAYMLKIGHLEHRVYQLKTDIARWRRRFSMRQAALNRGEKISVSQIEAALDLEFSAYLEEIKKHIEEIKKAAEEANAPRLTQEETDELRYLYLKAVKKLHPDLNGNLPPSAVKLWHSIQKAHDEKDWLQFKLLCELVDGVVSGDASFEEGDNPLEALRDACDRLAAELANAEKLRSDMLNGTPFVYEPLLRDEGKVLARQKMLQQEIAALEECIRQYEDLWKNG